MKNADMMGRVVTVTAVVERESDYVDGYTVRAWARQELAEPRAGWVTGFRSLQNGTIRTYAEEYDDVPYLSVTATVPVVLVAFGPSRNSVRVPLDAVELGGEPDPGRESRAGWESEWARKIAQDLPRDERGRFS